MRYEWKRKERVMAKRKPQGWQKEVEAGYEEARRRVLRGAREARELLPKAPVEAAERLSRELSHGGAVVRRRIDRLARVASRRADDAARELGHQADAMATRMSREVTAVLRPLSAGVKKARHQVTRDIGQLGSRFEGRLEEVVRTVLGRLDVASGSEVRALQRRLARLEKKMAEPRSKPEMAAQAA